MQRFESLAAIAAAGLGETVVTIGNFDGVHRGHAALIKELVGQARALEAQAVAVTFEPHPVRFFRGPEYPPFCISRPEQKCAALAALGVDATVILPFDRDLASLSPEKFVSEILNDALDARFVLVGYDFSFGKGRTGTIRDLERLGAEHQFRARSFAAIDDQGSPISSSRIRAAIRAGEVVEASRLMERDFVVDGVVEQGDARGRKIGFPTANLRQSHQLAPATGIYVTTLIRYRDGATFPSVSSIGTRPTYYRDDDAPVTIEAFVLDAPEGFDVYNEKVGLALHRYLRPEVAFESTEALVAQIDDDVAKARRFHDLG